MRHIIILLFLCLGLSSCDDLFKPAIENNKDIEGMYTDARYAQGLLGSAYRLLPYSNNPASDLATDDAVSNETSNNWSKIATGGWSALTNPTSYWDKGFHAVQYLNLFLSIVDDVLWDSDENMKMLFRDRLKGEALGLRALQYYYLLQAHGGWTEDGQLMGVPVKTVPEDNSTNFNQPRKSYADCVKFIFDDCTAALELLPTDYKTHSEAEVPQKYKDKGIVDPSTYDRVFGSHMGGRMSGRIVEAIRAQVALMASSPIFAEASGVTSEQAALYAADVLNRIGFVLPADGLYWYENMENVVGGTCPDELIWRGNNSNSNGLESNNFPPSLYGNGKVNPTQNIVDAFPMQNGYPISDIAQSGYNPNKPYEGRDPRLAKYIVCNGSKMSGKTITTGVYGGTIDGLNKEVGFSTKTGYYLRKLMREDCNLDPNFNTKVKHYTAYIRYTEIFLAYAEAANEAWGPTDNSHGMSAYQVIKAIRERAGITGGDPYLESKKNSKEDMREMIRNERRLELCFENHRFWDLRRWQKDLNETTKGISMTTSADDIEYIEVERRLFEPYMNFGPIPEKEVLKFDNLLQNKGW